MRYGAIRVRGTGVGMVKVADVLCVPAEAQMTRPASDDTGTGSPGRAVKRIKDLLRDAWGVEAEENGWLIRAPMDDHWQRWVRVDSEWAAMTEWKAKEKLKQSR